MTGIAELNRSSKRESAMATLGAARHSIGRAIPSPPRIVVPIRSDLAVNESNWERLQNFAARHVLFLLRLSLATIFFWFGVLKVADVSPVVDLLRSSLPFLARPVYLQLLGMAEITIGMGLLFDRIAKQATALMILHLLGTLSLFVIAPSVIFAPAFPVLSMDGEFVLKNLVLIAAALVIVCHRTRLSKPSR